MENLINVREVAKAFPIRSGFFSRAKGAVQAVRGVSFEVRRGETLGLVGESGCGKTTLGRILVRLLQPDRGKILFEGAEITRIRGEELKSFRQKIQMIFQDPYASLNPRMTIGETIAEPLVIHQKVTRGEKRKRVGELLEQVGLSPDWYDRYPHEFSGGQRQRIGIARAIALSPALIVADEPVSALDVSIAAQVLELLKDLKKRLNVSFLFIAHDLRMVRYMSDRIAVMYLGKIVEMAPREGFGKPLHPYTQALIQAVPVADPENRRKKIVLSGEVPSPVSPPSGCTFHPRCPFAEAICREKEPELIEWRPRHWAACHLADKIHVQAV